MSLKIQFSFRSAIALLIITVMGLGYMAGGFANVRKRRAAIAAIEGMGGRVGLSSPGIRERLRADWLATVGYRDYYDRVEFVAFHGADEKRWTIAELERYGQHATAQQLSRWEPWTTDNVVRVGKHLQVLDHLEGLSFCRTKLPPNSVQAISRLTQLKRLDLSATELRGSDLRFLRKLRSLELLGLQKNSIDSASIAHLKSLRSLQHLDLRWTPVDDAALQHLREIQSLDYLNLENTGVTDAGVHLLEGLSLRDLDLGMTEVSPASLHSLAQLSSLERVVVGYRFDNESITELKQHLPACQVEWNAGLPKR